MVVVQKNNKVNEMSCVHHWLIEEANGPVSSGSCRKCGKVKNFNNSVGKAGWSDKVTKPDTSGKLAA